MAFNDPFDDVLKALGLYERVQAETSAVIEMRGGAQRDACRAQVMNIDGKAAAIQQAPSEVRERWALKLIKFIHNTPFAANQTRPLDFTLTLDGTVRIGCGVAEKGTNIYPARYRIPPSTISDLPLQEQVWRAEKFALGMFLYEIFTGHKPFEGLDDDEVQEKYSNADFPQDLGSVEPLSWQSLIYACWSAEFGRYITLSRFQQYVHDNPMWFTLQVASGVIGLATLITLTLLSAVGFAASGGPVAGVGQGSIGAVEAGSLFAICQSAAMAGRAARGPAIVGATGLVITVVASSAAAMAASELPGAEKLRRVFMKKFRKGPSP